MLSECWNWRKNGGIDFICSMKFTWIIQAFPQIQSLCAFMPFQTFLVHYKLTRHNCSSCDLDPSVSGYWITESLNHWNTANPLNLPSEKFLTEFIHFGGNVLIIHPYTHLLATRSSCLQFCTQLCWCFLLDDSKHHNLFINKVGIWIIK